VTDPLFRGTLGNVFRIPNGTVLIVENYTGDVPSAARVRVGAFSATLVSVDIPRQANREAPIIALYIQEDATDILVDMKGQEVRGEHP
jgi:small-conductance mechanosensitive channel